MFNLNLYVRAPVSVSIFPADARPCAAEMAGLKRMSGAVHDATDDEPSISNPKQVPHLQTEYVAFAGTVPGASMLISSPCDSDHSPTPLVEGQHPCHGIEDGQRNRDAGEPGNFDGKSAETGKKRGALTFLSACTLTCCCVWKNNNTWVGLAKVPFACTAAKSVFFEPGRPHGAKDSTQRIRRYSKKAKQKAPTVTAIDASNIGELTTTNYGLGSQGQRNYDRMHIGQAQNTVPGILGDMPMAHGMGTQAGSNQGGACAPPVDGSSTKCEDLIDERWFSLHCKLVLPGMYLRFFVHTASQWHHWHAKKSRYTVRASDRTLFQGGIMHGTTSQVVSIPRGSPTATGKSHAWGQMTLRFQI
jgi:hypothetical protein